MSPRALLDLRQRRGDTGGDDPLRPGPRPRPLSGGRRLVLYRPRCGGRTGDVVRRGLSTGRDQTRARESGCR